MNEFRLFAHGETFDVDALLTTTKLKPDYVWRRGDQRRRACIESRHETSGIEFVLGDGLNTPFLEQERIAIAYLETNRDDLRSIADTPGADTFILGLQYWTEFRDNVIGFSVGPSPKLMWWCLAIGVRPVYYAYIRRLHQQSNEEE